jgi:hypothetical protein
VLETFAIDREGGPILIPVTIQGKAYPFVVDTGASLSTFDLRLRPLLGKAAGEETVVTPGGQASLRLVRAPEAHVGRLPFPRDRPVGVADLAPLRQAVGVEVAGILGMDFLAGYALRLDIEGGRLDLARSGGPNPGQPLPLKIEDGLPWVEGHLTSIGPGVWFNIDTGCGGPSSGGLNPGTYRVYEQLGLVKDAGWRLGTTMAGHRQAKEGRSTWFRIGPYTHQGLCFEEHADCCRLGLAFWSRYAATFDFPGGVLYLRKGKGPDGPDALDGSGIKMLERNGCVVVEEVREGSPALVAGIRKGDEVLSIAGRDVKMTSVPAAARLLCGEGRTVPVTLRRAAEVRTVPVALDAGWRTAKKEP